MEESSKQEKLLTVTFTGGEVKVKTNEERKDGEWKKLAKKTGEVIVSVYKDASNYLIEQWSNEIKGVKSLKGVVKAHTVVIDVFDEWPKQLIKTKEITPDATESAIFWTAATRTAFKLAVEAHVFTSTK